MLRAVHMIRLLLIASTLLGAQAFARSGLPDFTELVERSSPAVVKINTVTKQAANPGLQLPPGHQIPELFRQFLEPRDMQRRDMHSMGSGFFISEDGYVLTNNHVIENADEIVVRLTDRREFKAEIIGVDPLSDLALLKVDESGLPYLTLAKTDSLKVGEWVLAIGSPFGLDFSASAGIVSAKGRSIPNGSSGDYVPFIQTDVAINPGNSGGPLFNLDGEVVGVNSQIYTRSGGSIGLSFAIPAPVAINVIAQLKSKGQVDRGWLGVVIQEVDKDLADSFGLKKPRGALIASLEADGPAEKGGIKVGDIIISFNGKDIVERSDLPHAVGLTPPGQTVPVTVVRQGKERELKVKVGVRNGDNVASNVPGQPSAKSKGGRLGVVVAEVSADDLKRLRLKGGVVVSEVAPDSPAAEAGIQAGDIVAQLGFEEIDNVKEFNRIVADLPKDNLLPIRFFRNGQPIFRTITLKK